MKKTLLAVCLCVIAFQPLFSQSTAVKNTGRVEGFSAERLKLLDQNIEKWIADGLIPGAVVLITRNGQTVYNKSFGYNDVDKKTPLKTDQLFRLASQTKAITSVGIMQLYEQGKLMLDDSVAKYIPEFANAKVIDKFNPADTTYTTLKANRPITIRDLLTHTSGIGYAQIGSATANALYAKNNITAGIGTGAGPVLGPVIRRLGTLPLMHQPGKQFTYGLNTDVLGFVIEVVSGMSLDRYFRKNIFDPLGMNDTWFYLPAQKHSRLTTLTREDENGLHAMKEVNLADPKIKGLNPAYPTIEGTYFSGGAGLTGSIHDYAIFLQAILNGGIYNGKRILSPNSVRMMTSNQIRDLSLGDEKFGLGFSVATTQSAANAPVSVGTFGWGGAFGTQYWVDPKEKITAQFYIQVYSGRYNAGNAFKVLVYQALNNHVF